MAFAHLTLATRDVPRTIEFYEQTLGWKNIPRPGNIEQQGAWLQITEHQQLHLLGVSNFEPSAYEDEFGRHVAVFFPGDEFDALKLRIENLGGEVIAAKRATPFERFFFRDFNGYVFEVIDEQGYHAANSG